jgi:hypothetical protein
VVSRPRKGDPAGAEARERTGLYFYSIIIFFPVLFPAEVDNCLQSYRTVAVPNENYSLPRPGERDKKRRHYRSSSPEQEDRFIVCL